MGVKKAKGAANGKFFSLCRSNTVSTPAPDSSDAIDENWTDVAENYERIYALSGGYTEDNNSGELQELFEERLHRLALDERLQHLGTAPEEPVDDGFALQHGGSPYSDRIVMRFSLRRACAVAAVGRLRPTEAPDQALDVFPHQRLVSGSIQYDVCAAHFYGQRHLGLDAPKRFRFAHAVPLLQAGDLCASVGGHDDGLVYAPMGAGFKQ